MDRPLHAPYTSRYQMSAKERRRIKRRLTKMEIFNMSRAGWSNAAIARVAGVCHQRISQIVAFMRAAFPDVVAAEGRPTVRS